MKLSAEAKSLLKVWRKNAQAAYETDLNEAWDLIDATAVKIAERHSKSLQRVKFALHMGCGKATRSSQNKSNVWNTFLWKESDGGTAG